MIESDAFRLPGGGDVDAGAFVLRVDVSISHYLRGGSYFEFLNVFGSLVDVIVQILVLLFVAH